jgi:hypothetical protein
MRRYSGNITNTHDMLKRDESRFRGSFAPVILQPGDYLFRFARNREAKYSDCWTDKETIKHIFQSYHDRLLKKPAEVNKKSTIKAQVYNTLAIAKSWNTLEYLVVVEIKKDLIAYEGIIEQQSFFQSIDLDEHSQLRDVKMTGGGRQFITPRIRHYASKRDVATIHRYMTDYEICKFDKSSWYKRLVTAGYTL